MILNEVQEKYMLMASIDGVGELPKPSVNQIVWKELAPIVTADQDKFMKIHQCFVHAKNL